MSLCILADRVVVTQSVRVSQTLSPASEHGYRPGTSWFPVAVEKWSSGVENDKITVEWQDHRSPCSGVCVLGSKQLCSKMVRMEGRVSAGLKTFRQNTFLERSTRHYLVDYHNWTAAPYLVWHLLWKLQNWLLCMIIHRDVTSLTLAFKNTLSVPPCPACNPTHLSILHLHLLNIKLCVYLKGAEFYCSNLVCMWQYK